MKALVICTGGGIGDVLLATPVMRALRTRYAQVVALTAPGHYEVLAAQPALHEVWTDEGSLPVMTGRIRAARFDAAIVTWAGARSAALPFLARVPRRVGQTGRLYSHLFTDRVTVRSERGDRHSHWTEILLDFARALNCDAGDTAPVFPLGPAVRAQARRQLAAAGVSGPYVVLHPTRGIATQRPWPTRGLSELGRALRVATGATLVISGSLDDRAIALELARDAGGVSLAGATSLPVFGAVAEGALAVVAMDSGPMHIAAAVGAPTVGIFALQSDQPERWAPRGPRVAVVRASYPCPPHHRKETCPDFACIAQLDVARIVAATSGLLAKRSVATADA